MAVKISSYPVARDYRVDCITREDDLGNKSYEIAVVFETLGLTVESFKNIKNPKDANVRFKETMEKYKTICFM